MDSKMFRLKLQELLAMCPEEEGEEEEGGEEEAHESQDGQPAKAAAIDDGGQDSLTEGGEAESTFFPKSTNKTNKKKLDVIAATMKKKLNR